MWPRVKICCMGSIEEAALAIRYGASAVGLVSAMPSGPGVIDESFIASIAATIPPGVASFLLTSETKADTIIDQQRRLRVNTIQLCDRLEVEELRSLHRALPGIAIVQVVHVTGWDSFEEARKISSEVNGLLLDSGKPDLPIKELGGTGRVHNWEISRKICEEVSVPVFLAGGLGPHNVRAAIAQVGPYGIDVCGGVRTNGQLNEAKLTAFTQEIRSCAPI